MESLWLEKISTITKSNHPPIPAVPTNPARRARRVFFGLKSWKEKWKKKQNSFKAKSPFKLEKPDGALEWCQSKDIGLVLNSSILAHTCAYICTRMLWHADLPQENESSKPTGSRRPPRSLATGSGKLIPSCSLTLSSPWEAGVVTAALAAAAVLTTGWSWTGPLAQARARGPRTHPSFPTTCPSGVPALQHGESSPGAWHRAPDPCRLLVPSPPSLGFPLPIRPLLWSVL